LRAPTRLIPQSIRFCQGSASRAGLGGPTLLPLPILAQTVQELGLALRGEAGRRREQSEKIDSEGGFAEVLEAIRTASLDMLADHGVFLTLERAEQVEFVEVV
jgi:hypothetical protein